jgi:hypothetical protein
LLALLVLFAFLVAGRLLALLVLGAWGFLGRHFYISNAKSSRHPARTGGAFRDSTRVNFPAGFCGAARGHFGEYPL